MIRRHLGVRLSLFLSLLCLSALGTLVHITTKTASQALLREAQDEAQRNARFLANGLVEHVRREGDDSLPDFLSNLMQGTSADVAAVYRPNQQLVFASTRVGAPAADAQPQLCWRCHTAGLSATGPRDGVLPGRVDGEPTLRAVLHLDNSPSCQPCHLPTEPLLGVIEVEQSLASIHALRRQAALWSGLAGLGTVAFLLLGTIWLVARLVHKPLKTLEGAMSHLSAGDLAVRLPPLGEDEVGHLATGFNSMAASLQTKVEQLESLAVTDFLTNLTNHRGFQERLRAEISRSDRYSRLFSLLILDIDHFKQVNDRRGHQAGDAVLEQLGALLHSHLRQADLGARYGGEEFAVILPEADRDEALSTAERLRAAVEKHRFLVGENEDPIRVTVSIGLATFPLDSGRAEGLVTAADIALLRAKHLSRNAVCVYSAMSRAGDGDEPYLLHCCLEEATVESVAALVEQMERREPYARGHSRRVAELAAEVGGFLGFSEADKEAVRLAALLHDIGMIGIPPTVLEKTGGLTVDERKLINTHPSVGGAILKAIGQLAELVPAVEHHHERYDGTGYPQGLKGDTIPLFSRVLAAADAAAAMLSARPYRSSFDADEVTAELERQSGAQFDPVVVEAIIRILRRTASPSPQSLVSIGEADRR